MVFFVYFAVFLHNYINRKAHTPSTYVFQYFKKLGQHNTELQKSLAAHISHYESLMHYPSASFTASLAYASCAVHASGHSTCPRGRLRPLRSNRLRSHDREARSGKRSRRIVLRRISQSAEVGTGVILRRRPRSACGGQCEVSRSKQALRRDRVATK